MLDIKITGGTAYDGSRGLGISSDVCITGGFITEMGDLSSPESLESVAATGKAVTPGFISLRTHSDASFLVAP